MDSGLLSNSVAMRDMRLEREEAGKANCSGSLSGIRMRRSTGRDSGFSLDIFLAWRLEGSERFFETHK